MGYPNVLYQSLFDSHISNVSAFNILNVSAFDSHILNVSAFDSNILNVSAFDSNILNVSAWGARSPTGLTAGGPAWVKGKELLNKVSNIAQQSFNYCSRKFQIVQYLKYYRVNPHPPTPPKKHIPKKVSNIDQQSFKYWLRAEI